MENDSCTEQELLLVCYYETYVFNSSMSTWWIYATGHINIGIIFCCTQNYQWCIYNPQSKSDWLLHTQSRVLQTDRLILENNEKANSNISMPYSIHRVEIPVIIMGETGCGKTKLIDFMSKLQVPTALKDEINTMIIVKVGKIDHFKVQNTLGRIGPYHKRWLWHHRIKIGSDSCSQNIGLLSG